MIYLYIISWYLIGSISLLVSLKKNSNLMVMIPITKTNISDKVRCFYQINKWSKPIDEILYIASEPTTDGTRVRIIRLNKYGLFVEGGYVRLDELFEAE